MATLFEALADLDDDQLLTDGKVTQTVVRWADDAEDVEGDYRTVKTEWGVGVQKDVDGKWFPALWSPKKSNGWKG